MIPRLFLGLFIVFLASVGGAAGQTCPNIPTNPTNESGEPSVIRTESPTCTAPDVPSGAYIKVQTQGPDPDAYKVHFRATSSGSCQLRYYGCYPCQCYNGASQLRTLGTSTVRGDVPPAVEIQRRLG